MTRDVKQIDDFIRDNSLRLISVSDLGIDGLWYNINTNNTRIEIYHWVDYNPADEDDVETIMFFYRNNKKEGNYYGRLDYILNLIKEKLNP